MLCLALGLTGFCMAADAPVKTAIASHEVKAVGEVYCDGGNEFQKYALMAKFKDKTEATEVYSWSEMTGKTCESKARGNTPDKPNAEGWAKMMKATSSGKSRGGPCGCYYTYYWYGSCVYYDYYDCNWNYCDSAWRCY